MIIKSPAAKVLDFFFSFYEDSYKANNIKTERGLRMLLIIHTIVGQALALAVRVIALCVLANYRSLNGLLCDGNQAIIMNSKLGVHCQASKLVGDGVPMDLLIMN